MLAWELCAVQGASCRGGARALAQGLLLLGSLSPGLCGFGGEESTCSCVDNAGVSGGMTLEISAPSVAVFCGSGFAFNVPRFACCSLSV